MIAVSRRWCLQFMVVGAAVGHLPSTVLAQTAAKAKATSKAAKPASGRLPDEGLRRAQQAEKQLAANQPQDAIKTLAQLDKDFPGHAAVSLRLAQVYDKLDDAGPALFYFRRYIARASDRAREEATVRAYALEMTPGAKAAAEEFGKKLGEATKAATVPTPSADWQIAAEREDGSLVPIKNEKELERLAKQGELPQSAPAASPAGPTPIVLSFDQQRVLSSPGASSEPAAEPVRSTPRSAGPKAVYAHGTPAAEDEDAALALAFSKGQKLSTIVEPTPTPTPTPMVVDRRRTNPPSLQQGMPGPEGASLANAPTPRQPQQPRPPGRTPAIGTIAFTSPTPNNEVVSPRAGRFFTAKVSSTGKTTIRLVNNLPEAVITFVALPDDDGEPINIILAKDESRNIEVKPGDYEVSANISTVNYPPVTLLEAKFPYTFAASTQYTRRFTSETLEQVR